MSAARLPDGALDGRYVAALAAVLQLHHRQGRVTIREVAAACGCAPRTALDWLQVLSDAGFVAWERGQAGGGTLRPLVEVVAAG